MPNSISRLTEKVNNLLEDPCIEPLLDEIITTFSEGRYKIIYPESTSSGRFSSETAFDRKLLELSQIQQSNLRIDGKRRSFRRLKKKYNHLKNELQRISPVLNQSSLILVGKNSDDEGFPESEKGSQLPAIKVKKHDGNIDMQIGVFGWPMEEEAEPSPERREARLNHIRQEFDSFIRDYGESLDDLTFGQYLKHKRKEAGYSTAKDFAEAAGLNYSYVQELECGSAYPRQMHTIERLESALGEDPALYTLAVIDQIPDNEHYKRKFLLLDDL